MKWFLFLLLSFSLNAAPVGNPAACALLKKGILTSRSSSLNLRAGFEGNFIFDRRLEQYQEGSGRVDNYELYSTSADLVINFKNRLDLYADLGDGKIKSDWRTKSNTMLNRVVLISNHHFLWAVGTNILLLDWRRASMGIGGRYTSIDPDLRKISINGVKMDIADSTFTYHKWQANLAFSYTLDFLIPYIGFKYSNANSFLHTPHISGIATNGSNTNHFESKDNVGLYLGTSITNGIIFMINLEVRLIDEEAVSVLAEFRF